MKGFKPSTPCLGNTQNGHYQVIVFVFWLDFAERRWTATQITLTHNNGYRNFYSCVNISVAEIVLGRILLSEIAEVIISSSNYLLSIIPKRIGEIGVWFFSLSKIGNPDFAGSSSHFVPPSVANPANPYILLTIRVNSRLRLALPSLSR